MGLLLWQAQVGPISGLFFPRQFDCCYLLPLIKAALIQQLIRGKYSADIVIGSGIGREVALTLASHGATALICADIKLETAEKTAEMSKFGKDPRAAGFKAQALQVDVKDEKSVQQMVEDAKSLFGRIDYFVNTAGVSTRRASGSPEPSVQQFGLMI